MKLSRRKFVTSSGAAGLGLLAGCGPLSLQQPPPTAVKVYRLGWLSGTSPTGQAPVLEAFRRALGEPGYVEGQNLIIEYRWGDGSEARLAEPAAELARLPVDIFVVPAVSLARIAREAT